MTEKSDRIGPYVLRRLLGSGGMAEVWEASPHHEPEARVAIKRLLRHDGAGTGSRQRLIDEAHLGTALSHPNLARTLDIIEEGREVAAVLELLDGLTVAEIVQHHTVPPLGWTLGVALQVLDGLDYLHNARGPDGRLWGLVHRDLKPSNLFVTRSGAAKIIDFGIASLQGSERTLTRTGVLRGSLPYTSPEVARQDPLDARSDLFSFGLVLYELLTGERCYPQANDAAVLSAVLWSPAPRLREAPDWLGDLVAQLLEKDPSRRPESAAQVRDAIVEKTQPHERFSPAQISAWLATVPAHPRADATASGRDLDALALSALPPPELGPRRRGRIGVAVASLGVLVALGLAVAGVVIRRDSSLPPAPTAAAPVEPPPAPAAAAPSAPPLPTAEPVVAHAPAAPEARPPRASRPHRPAGEGSLTVGVKPGWATVEVDGKAIGPSPLFRHALGAGRHTVSAVRQDGRRQTRVVEIQEGKERRVSIEWDEP